MSRILDIRFFMLFPFSLSKFHGSIGQMEKFTRKSHLSILYLNFYFLVKWKNLPVNPTYPYTVLYLKMSSMANKR